MPFFIASLLIQIALCWHAARTGRAQPWIWIILLFPGIGSLVYVVTQIVPEWFGSPRGQRATTALVNAVAPGRHYRALAEAAEAVPTVENRANLAAECLRLGRHAEAIALYEGCLTGIHATDPKLLGGLAEASLAAGDAPGALGAIERLRDAAPELYSADLHLTYARALEGTGANDAALEEYTALADRYPGEEARCRQAMLLHRLGRTAEADALFQAILRNGRHRPASQRQAQKPWEDIARSMVPG
ncbi:MAG TPA: hypothetical protein VGM87_09795 [Roseomonas sp.]|jgi:hypothetical protein